MLRFRIGRARGLAPHKPRASCERQTKPLSAGTMDDQARLLVIDTATEALSVALFQHGVLIGHFHEIAGRGHAEKLIPIIAALPDGGKASEIWVDSGPGSFTGIRVGLAAARALSYAWGARLRTYSSLALLAAMARQEQRVSATISIALTGGHGELFWQEFDPATLAPLAAPASIPIAELAYSTAAPVIHGAGAGALVAARGHGEARLLHPRADAATLMPIERIGEETTPLYGRGADALPLASAQKHLA